MPPTPISGRRPSVRACSRARTTRGAARRAAAPERPPASAAWRLRRPSRARVVLVATMPAMPAASATSTMSASSRSLEVGGDLQEERHRAGEGGVRGHHAGEQGRERRAALQVAQPLGVGRGDVDGGEVDEGAGGGAAPRRSRRRGRRSSCWRRGSGRRCRPAAARRGGRRSAATPSLLKPKRLMTARSSVRRKSRGRGLPGCGSGVAAPTSTKPKPARPSGATARGVLVEAGGETERVRQVEAGEAGGEARAR